MGAMQQKEIVLCRVLVLLDLLVVLNFLGISLLGKSSTEDSVPECKIGLRKVGLDAIGLMMNVMANRFGLTSLFSYNHPYTY